jgi:hypothetical protein
MYCVLVVPISPYTRSDHELCSFLTAKLQEAGTAGTQRMLELAQEWERHRQPLVDALLEKEEVLNKVGSGEYSSVVSRGVVLSVLYG